MRFDTHSDGILVGSVLALLPAKMVGKVGDYCCWTGASYLLACFIVPYFTDFATTNVGYSVTTLAAAAIVAKLAAHPDASITNIFDFKVLAWLRKLFMVSICGIIRQSRYWFIANTRYSAHSFPDLDTRRFLSLLPALS